jgi:tetratricopeptide (TPR) repeat protein
MNRTLLTAFLFLCAVSANAADKWTRVQSKNFLLVGSATENEIREVAEGLEVFRTSFSKFFEVKNGPSVPTTVVVFRSDQAFKPFKPVYQGKPANVAGYFQPGQDTNFIALAADMDTPRVIYHELVHRLLSDNLGGLPLWFQEGFAECFSSIKIIGRDKKVQIGNALAEHVELLNQRNFMPLEKLFAIAHGSKEYNEEEKQGLFYAESWAFVHYMMFDSAERRAQFMTFLNGISNGAPTAQVFQQVFKTDLPTFQKTFEAYIQQRMAWNAFEVNTAAGLDRSKDMTARMMTEAESESYLGDMLLHLRRYPEAEEHLAKAVKLDSKLGIAQASMGRLLMQTNKESDALAYFQRATELDPSNYLTHYYYAALLNNRKAGQPSEADWATVQTELKKTIQLAPQFTEATQMLASANLTRNVDIPETIEMLTNAWKLAPGDDFLPVQLAIALSRTQQRERARPIARNLLARPSLDAPLRQNMESLLTFLDRAAAAETANRAVTERIAAAREFAGNNAPAPPPEFTKDERAQLQRVLDDLPPGTEKISGILVLLDCKSGLTLSLIVDGKAVKMHTNTPNTLKFTSFNPAVSKQITCGPTPGGGVPAAVVYRPKKGPDDIGEPLSVEFLDDGAPRTASLPTIPGASMVKGLLTKLECAGDVSIEVNADGKTLLFGKVEKSKVAFLNGPNSDGTFTCGPIPAPGLPVVILYYPSKSGDVVGDPIVIQYQR